MKTKKMQRRAEQDSFTPGFLYILSPSPLAWIFRQGQLSVGGGGSIWEPLPPTISAPKTCFPDHGMTHQHSSMPLLSHDKAWGLPVSEAGSAARGEGEGGEPGEGELTARGPRPPAGRSAWRPRWRAAGRGCPAPPAAAASPRRGCRAPAR